jgi:DNA-directed RNA polymerase subunit RPC12/RpoP
LRLNETKIPRLECPYCSANILVEGFSNYCSETVRVCEFNFAVVFRKRIYIDHDDRERLSQDHECSVEAICSKCKKKLPWSVSELRSLSGVTATQLKRRLGKIAHK